VEFREVLLTQLRDTSNLWAENLDWMVETKTGILLDFKLSPCSECCILSFG
jgi:hypothetical protein